MRIQKTPIQKPWSLNLADRLRELAGLLGGTRLRSHTAGSLLREAADEVDRLRAENVSLQAEIKALRQGQVNIQAGTGDGGATA